LEVEDEHVAQCPITGNANELLSVQNSAYILMHNCQFTFIKSWLDCPNAVQIQIQIY